MKHPALFLLYAVGGAAIGWMSVAWQPARESRTIDESREAARAGRPVWNQQDFLRAARESGSARPAANGQPPGYLKHWPTADILAVLDDSLTDGRTLAEDDPGIAGDLLREYLTRDFDAGLHWFKKSSALHQAALSNVLSDAWPADKSADGLEFMIANREIFTRKLPWAIVAKAITAAASQGGPEAVAAIEERLRRHRVGLDLSTAIPFPPGFDFAKLLVLEKARPTTNDDFDASIIRSWALQDREAAFRGAMENQGGIGVLALVGPSGDSSGDTAQWLGSKIATFSTEEREGYMQLLTLQYMNQPGGASRFLQGCQDPELRKQTVTEAARMMFSDYPNISLGLLEQLPDMETRITFLETLHRDGSGDPIDAPDAIDEAHLRKKLREWNAGDERIQKIFSLFKKP